MAKHITVQQTDTETGEIVTLVALKPGRAPIHTATEDLSK